MFAGSVPLHGQDVSGFLLALPHQEVAVLHQQLLNLQSGNSSVVPDLLFQGTLQFLPHGPTWQCLITRSTKKHHKKGVFKKSQQPETTVFGVKGDSVEDIWKRQKKSLVYWGGNKRFQQKQSWRADGMKTAIHAGLKSNYIR